MKKPRNTNAKSAILEIIEASKVALSHSEIQELLNGICDRVTIYRVLERLKKEDKIHKTISIDGISKYAVCNHNEGHHHDHIHFNCERCESVICLENVVPKFTIPNGYKINEVNFTVSGYCPKCI